MQNSVKFTIQTNSDKVYVLHIIEAIEYKANQFVGLFLYGDDETKWKGLRHRILFENSIEAIKDKVIEYANGRNEKVMFIDNSALA